jgi:hypothetical protein
LVPYVDLVWPHSARIRDFSRMVPVAAKPGDLVVGYVEGLPVALRRRVGKGALLYLGSPVGPALLAGDAEAHTWLQAIVAAA